MSPSFVYLSVTVRISVLPGNVQWRASRLLDLCQGPFLRDDDVSFHDMIMEMRGDSHGPEVVLVACLWRCVC